MKNIILAGLAFAGSVPHLESLKKLPDMRNYGCYQSRFSGVAAAKRKAKKLKNIRRAKAVNHG